MRVVLDTNILISGLLRPAGPPGRIVSAWREGQFELALSEPLMEECQRALRYPKIRAVLAKAGWSEVDLRDFVDLLRMKAVIVKTEGLSLEAAPRDPNDHPVVAALLASGAEFLVTGDKKHLLALGLPQVVTAAEFVARMEAFRGPTTAQEPRPSYRLPKGRRERASAHRRDRS